MPRQPVGVSVLMVTVLAVFASLQAHGATAIRFVDGESGVPLEYWQKETPLPNGGTMFWRAPQTIHVDGKPRDYARYRAETALGEEDSAAVSDQDVLDLLDGEAAGGGEKKTVEILSERSAAILEGFKAEIHGEWGTGTHVLEPGGLSFAFVDDAVKSSSPVLTQVGAGCLQVACRPLEVSVAPVPGTLADLALAVESGGAVVLPKQGFRAARPDGGCAVRLYLPVSEQPYVIETSRGVLTLVHGANGVTLKEATRLSAGWQVRVAGHSVLLYPKGRRQAPSGKPKTMPPALYLFTDRNREAYCEGEVVEFSLRAVGKVGGDAEFTITGPGGPLKLSVPGGGTSGEIRFDTSLLRPGTYQVHVQAGQVQSNPVRLILSAAMPTTNLKLFSWSKWGSSSYEPQDLQVAVQNGLNLVCHGAGYGQGGAIIGGSPFEDTGGLSPATSERPRDAKRLKEWQKPGFPVELLEEKNQHDRGAEYLLANGVSTVPITGGAILYFNVGEAWAHHAADRYQTIQHFGQEWRRFPNFAGMVHCTGDGPTPASTGMVWAAAPGAYDIIHDQRIAKLKERVQQQVGTLQVDGQKAQAELDRVSREMDGAIGFGVGTELGIEVEGGEKQKLLWTSWLNDLYPLTFREQRKALSAMMPDPIVNSGTSWGQGAGNGQWTETFYTPLDNPVSDYHGDYGIFPFSYVSGVDLMDLGQGKRPWMGLDILPERTFPNGMKLFLQAMSRNPAGIGFLQTKEDHIAGGWGSTKEHGDQMAVLLEMGKRFGDLLLHLERRDEIAVFASLRQASLKGQGFDRLWGAHFLASKAGYQANFVSERQVLADPSVLTRYKAVFLVDLTTALPPATEKVLLDYQKKGGVLLATKRTTIELPGLVKVPSGKVRGANEVKYKHVYVGFDPHIEAFKKTVPSQVEPFFTADEEDVHLCRSVDGDLEYWTLFHDGIVDKRKLDGSSHFVQFLYKGTKARLTAKRGGVLYDALERKAVLSAVGKEEMAWDVDLMDLPGTYYLVSPRPLGAIKVKADKTVKTAGLFSLLATVEDSQGTAFTGRLPLEVVVRDPAGEERYRLYRTTHQKLSCKIAANDPAGTWTWQATEQATGLQAKGAFVVSSAAGAPRLSRAQELVYDRAAIGAALQERSFEILLFPEQAVLLDRARALQKKLATQGVECQVRLIAPAEVRNYPMSWNERTIEEKEIHAAVLAGRVLGHRVRGKNQYGTGEGGPEFAFYGQYARSAPWVYYKDIILLGQRGLPSGPLLDQICTINRMLPRNPSPNFPGPGQGLLAYAWAPCHYGHDAIVVYGADSGGLDRAVASLVKLAKGVAETVPSGGPLLARGAPEVGQTYEAMGLGPAAGVTEVAGTERARVSLMPRIYSITVDDAVAKDGKVWLKERGKADTKMPPFVEVDLKEKTVRRCHVAGREQRWGRADDFRQALEWETFPHLRIVTVDDGTIEPLGRGVARYDKTGTVVWHTEPAPQAMDYNMGKFPYRCHYLTLSADGKSLLASFFDLNKGGGYGLSLRLFSAPVILFLDAATGKERCRVKEYLGGKMVIAADSSRFAIYDTLPSGWARYTENPDGESVLGIFAADGKRLFASEVGPIDRLRISDKGELVLASYSDTSKTVTFIDVDKGTREDLSYHRIDTGLAVDPEGRFGLIAYADGVLRKVSPEGAVLSEQQAGAAGYPVLNEEGQLLLCGHDEQIHFPGTDTPPVPFGGGEPETLPHPQQSFTKGGTAPQPPFWQALKGDFAPGKPDKELLPGKGTAGKTHTLEVDVPKCDGLSVYLLDFTYELESPEDTLQVHFSSAGTKATYLYAYTSAPHRVSLPLRVREGGTVALRFECEKSVRLTGGSGRLLDLSVHTNAAQVSIEGKGTNMPRLVIPPHYGYFPGAYEVGAGFPTKYKGKLPPDLKPGVKSDIFSLFSGDHLSAAPLYPSRRIGVPAWDPPSTTRNLFGAWVFLEFPEPVEAVGLGVWQHPFDLPVSDYLTECGNSFKDFKGAESYEIRDDFRVVDSVWGNTDYYRLHQFKKPLRARFWRITIVDTPAVVQRLAELELYTEFGEMIDLDDDDDGGLGL